MRYFAPLLAACLCAAGLSAGGAAQAAGAAPAFTEIDAAQHQSGQHTPRKSRAGAGSGRGWLGVGAGVGYASVDVSCTPGMIGSDCEEAGDVRTYSANLTFAGSSAALRLRGIRKQDRGSGDRRTAYETAALVGARFGRSNWYGLIGAGRVRHADHDFQGDARGFAWEIVFAPSSSGPLGLELSFQGNSGHEVDFTLFNLGMRFGAMR